MKWMSSDLKIFIKNFQPFVRENGYYDIVKIENENGKKLVYIQTDLEKEGLLALPVHENGEKCLDKYQQLIDLNPDLRDENPEFLPDWKVVEIEEALEKKQERKPFNKKKNMVIKIAIFFSLFVPDTFFIVRGLENIPTLQELEKISKKNLEKYLESHAYILYREAKKMLHNVIQDKSESTELSARAGDLLTFDKLAALMAGLAASIKHFNEHFGTNLSFEVKLEG